MKKFIWLFAFTVLTIAVILLVAERNKAPKVPVHTVTTQTIERTVKCNGIIEAVDYEAVFPKTNCVIGEIFVKVGDVVKKGDPLFRVDVQATETLLVNTGKLSKTAFSKLSEEPEMTAPINGIITEMTLQEDVVTDMTKSLLIIAGTDELQVAIKVPESILKDVWIGQPAVVIGEGFKKDTYSGTVTFLSATANMNMTSGTMLDATVALNSNELDSSLRLGLSAKIHLLAETFEKGMVIPYSCLQADESGDYVLAIENGKATKKHVTIDAELTEGAVICNGIDEGDKLIKESEKYTEGQAVDAQ